MLFIIQYPEVVKNSVVKEVKEVECPICLIQMHIID